MHLKKYLFPFYPFLISFVLKIASYIVYLQLVSSSQGTDNAFSENSAYMFFVLLVSFSEISLFGLWYIKRFKREEKSEVTWRVLGYSLLIITFLNLSLDGLLSSVQHLFPSLLVGYTESISKTNTYADTVLFYLNIIFISPFAEELVYRGVTLNLARFNDVSFKATNIIQASLFALAHGNIVQCLYTFVFALFLGYICQKYNTILLPYFLHVVFNVWGLLLSPYLTNHSLFFSLFILITPILAFGVLVKKIRL